MADITIALGQVGLNFGDFVGGFLLGSDDLATGDDLKTNILVSLFSDPGWWANTYEADSWGCRLVELRAAKHSNDTLLKARDYCRQALAWLIEDRVASAVDVRTAWVGNLLAVAILITQATGVTRFSFEWTEI